MNNQVKEIVFTGPDGKLVGKYKKGQSLNPPIALLIHPHPLYGGTMNNPIIMDLFSIFDSLGFSIFRFNLRGVGKSEGKFDNGLGELADAAAGLDLDTKAKSKYKPMLGCRILFWGIALHAVVNEKARDNKICKYLTSTKFI